MESPLHDGKQVPLQPGNQTLPRDEHGNVAIQDSTFVEDDPDDLMESVFILEKPDSTGAIVWLHGLGRSVETERPVFEMIAPSHLTFYVPNASKMPITVLEDAEERAWYDVEHEVFSDDNDEDEFNIEDSARRIKDLLDKVCERFPPEKVVLGGFAQGGAMALHVGLSYEKKLAGIVSFSGYLVMPEYYPEHISEEARDTPVLAVHGNSDMAIPLEFAENRYSHLEEEGLDFEFRQDFYMGHFMGNESLLSTQGWMIDAIDRN